MSQADHSGGAAADSVVYLMATRSAATQRLPVEEDPKAQLKNIDAE